MDIGGSIDDRIPTESRALQQWRDKRKSFFERARAKNALYHAAHDVKYDMENRAFGVVSKDQPRVPPSAQLHRTTTHDQTYHVPVSQNQPSYQGDDTEAWSGRDIGGVPQRSVRGSPSVDRVPQPDEAEAMLRSRTSILLQRPARIAQQPPSHTGLKDRFHDGYLQVSRAVRMFAQNREPKVFRGCANRNVGVFVGAVLFAIILVACLSSVFSSKRRFVGTIPVSQGFPMPQAMQAMPQAIPRPMPSAPGF
jgi:hypothetical protein